MGQTEGNKGRYDKLGERWNIRKILSAPLVLLVQLSLLMTGSPVLVNQLLCPLFLQF